MCGLCAIFLTETHWSDAALGAERSRHRERLRRVALANRVLKHYGLKLGDWQGSAYLLSTQTGHTEIVPSIAAVWPAAQRMRSRTLDPLDEELIAALEAC